MSAGGSSRCASTRVGPHSSAARSSGPCTPHISRLVEELGLTLEPSYTAVAGATTYDLVEGVSQIGRRLPVRDRRRACGLRARRAALRRARRDGRPERSVGPPGRRIVSTRLVRRLASLRRRATATTVRALEVGALALAAGSIERTSLLAELRKGAAVERAGLLRIRALGVAPGRGGERGGRHPHGRGARRARAARGGGAFRDAWGASGCTVELDGGRGAPAEAVVSALPVSVLATVELNGVSDARVRVAPAPAPRARGEARHGLRPRGLGRPRRERAFRRGASPRVDLAAAGRCPLGARSAGADRLAARGRGGGSRDGVSTPSSSACTASCSGRALGDPHPALGDGPVHARLRHALVAGGRPARRAAPRHPRTAVLRLRLRPVGGGLHGGRGANRPRGRASGAGSRMRGAP